MSFVLKIIINTGGYLSELSVIFLKFVLKGGFLYVVKVLFPVFFKCILWGVNSLRWFEEHVICITIAKLITN